MPHFDGKKINFEQVSVMVTIHGEKPSNSWLDMHPVGIVQSKVSSIFFIFMAYFARLIHDEQCIDLKK